MTPISLFNVVLKIIGIFLIKDLLIFLPQLLSLFFYSNADSSFSNNQSENIGYIIIDVLSATVYILIIYLLIFRTQILIDKLKLDKGFDQNFIPLNLHRSAILSISTIVIGGLILINEIPNLINQIHFYFEQRTISNGKVGFSASSYLVLAAIKVFIGLILIIYQKVIVNFIEYKRKI